MFDEKDEKYKVYANRHKEIKSRYKELRAKMMNDGIYKEMELTVLGAEKCELMKTFLHEMAVGVSPEDWYSINEALSMSGTVMSEAKKEQEVRLDEIRRCVLDLVLKESIMDDKKILETTRTRLGLSDEDNETINEIVAEIKKKHLTT